MVKVQSAHSNVAMEVESLFLSKSKSDVAAAVRAACSSDAQEGGLLEQIVDHVLTNPKSLSDVDDDETLEWCQWLIAGGSTPDEFSQTVRLYDKATTCGKVWTENFVAYRCRTCGISPYLSLCTDCFHNGNHEGHDFIVFKSETGGACDCGEINIIKESGCCVVHGPRGTAAMQRAQMFSGRGSRDGGDPSASSSTDPSAPPELLSIANGMMPRLFHRLIAYLRAVEARKLARAQQLNKNNMNKSKKAAKPKTSHVQPVSLAATAAAMMANPAVSAPPKGHKFIKLLQGFSDMGVAMRQVVTNTLTNPPVYQKLCATVSPEYERVGLKIPEHHKTFLEELVYWTVKREFPEDLFCLLLSLSLKSDSTYNESFARAFITHYELISQSILKSSDPERLCKHIAAVSVQLFSKEKLAIAMVEQMQLLHLLLRSLYDMIRSTAVPIASISELSSSAPKSSSSSAAPSPQSDKISLEKEKEPVYKNSDIRPNNVSGDVLSSGSSARTLKVIDCDNDIIKNHYYWLIKSDLKELLSHGPVATKFFNDPSLLSTWFEFLTLLQGMNVNKFVEKGEPHVEHESDSYFGAFMAELVISATLMWTLVSHLQDNTSSDITLKCISLCRKQLNEWNSHVQYPKGTISFHLPLHRFLSTFARQGLQFQGMQIKELLPPESEFENLVRQLIRLQTAYYGISTRLWVRNGPSLVNQVEYYVSSSCCNSMVDADLFMLQLAAVREPGSSEDKFMEMLLVEFGMTDVLSIRNCFAQDGTTGSLTNNMNNDQEEQMTMMENLMIFLATLASVRTNLGIADHDLMALEMSVLLCKSDKLHSELMEIILDMQPERRGRDVHLKNFESVLAQIADFQAPKDMQQGIFTPKPRVWEEIYDPIYTLLRSSHRADYQNSRDRYQDYVSRSRKFVNAKNLWPPFRLPTIKPGFMADPGKVLLSKTFMEVAFVVLYHSVYTGILSELNVSLCVYLLEMAVCVAETEGELYRFMSEVTVLVKQEEGGQGVQERDESIVTLLMHLYSKLSENRKHFTLRPETCDDELPSSLVENRVGDGPFFLAKVLDKLAEKSEECKDYILLEITKHNAEENQSTAAQELASEEREREENRKRKVKERMLHLMHELAMKRDKWMSENSPTESIDISDCTSLESTDKLSSPSERLLHQFQDNECVICMEKLESKPNNPFGLMTYLSPCSILGYQRLHTPEQNGPFLKTIHKEALDELVKHYDDSSVIQHIPLDPGFGVQLQSCGHLIHQDCFTSYMSYVKKAPPPPPSSASSSTKQVISFTYKEYSCPLCRQLGNAFLPVILGKTKDNNGASWDFSEISKLIKKRNKCTLSNAEKTAVDSFIRDINACAMNNMKGEIAKQLKDFDPASPLVTAFLLTSHLRLALERQLKLTENYSAAAASGPSSSFSSSKKLSSLLPLLSVIKYQYKTLPVGYARKLAQNWEMICGKRTSKGNGEVPTLLRHVETELYHLVLELATLDGCGVDGKNSGVNVFNGMVQALYNLRLVQILTAICSQFGDMERREIARIYDRSESKLERIMGLILRSLSEETKVELLGIADGDIMKSDENGNHANVDVPETPFIENLVQSLLVPFMRVAALLKLEIFGDLGSISLSEDFSGLVEYLQLGSEDDSFLQNKRDKKAPQVIITEMDSSSGDVKSSVEYMYWRQSDNDNVPLECETVIANWCSELMQSVNHAGSEKRSSTVNVEKSQRVGELLKSHLYIYDKPSLIRLPREYDTIFENYRKIKCAKCDGVPSSPALCLICGEILCLNELCCFDLELEVAEVVSHCQKKCERGTGLFLSIMTSEILIVREKEACIWGSIFLDSFCEEDLELKRGKPLFLCQERFDILQRNWIAQSFYKSELKWFQHENFL